MAKKRHKPQDDTRFIWGAAAGVLAFMTLGRSNCRGEWRFTLFEDLNRKTTPMSESVPIKADGVGKIGRCPKHHKRIR